MSHTWIYVLHFEEPLSHAQHYCGQTPLLRQRLTQHANGDGARITQVLCENGSHWRLGGLYVPRNHAESARFIERLAKNQHGLAKFCPICNPTNYQTPPGTTEYDVSLIPFPTTSRELRRTTE